MFCHKVFLAFSERKNSTIDRLARGNDGAEEGEREQVIACTMIEYAAATTGEKMASICHVWWMGHQRCVRRSSMPDTSLPHASPYL